MGAAAGARRLVVQRRVRPLVIVLFAPFLQLLSRFTHAPKLDSTQYLVAHRPVVALYRLRLAVSIYQPVQPLRNIVAAEASRHLATQAFTTVVVYYVQYPIAPLVLQYVVHKVHAPSFVYLFRLSAFYSVESAFLATGSFAYLKMLLTVDSQKLLVVDIFTESAQVVEQQPITPAIVLLRKLFYLLAQCLLPRLFAVRKHTSRYPD